MALVSSSQVCLGMITMVHFGAFCTAENSAPGTACGARGSAGDAGRALSPTRKHPSAAWFGTGQNVSGLSQNGKMIQIEYRKDRLFVL